MATLTVKNIPDDLYARVKEAAARNRRSVNSEIIARIEASLMPTRVAAEHIVARVRRLHAQLGGKTLSVDQYDEARREGRP
jgi:plasmid stability protein